MTDFAVRTTRLSYTYPDGIKALDEIDFDVPGGQKVAVIGPSGAGKSTLLLYLTGVLKGTGSVRIMGLSLQPSNMRQIRRQVGLVFQDPNDQLFCPTVFEDVAFGLLNLSVPKSQIPSRVEKSLRDFGLQPSISLRSPYRLSLGERKRVSLAAVLALEPAILAMDDPTAGLDMRNRRRLIEAVSRLEATLIIATHDLEFVLDVCSRTVLMDQGKIKADGQSRSILADSGLMGSHGLEVPLTLGSGGR